MANRHVKAIDPIPDNLVLFFQGEVAAGRMTLREMNEALSAQWGGSYSPHPSNRGQLEGIEGTRSNGSLIGRETGNSFTRPPQNPMSRYDQINQREQATAADLDAQIAALGPQNLRPLPPPGGGFGGLGSGYRQGPSDTYGFPPPAPRGGPAYPDMSSEMSGLDNNPRYGLGHYLMRGIDSLIPLPNYVRDGIGARLDDPDGWWRNLFRQMPPPTGSDQPGDATPIAQSPPYDPGFGQPRDTAPRTNNSGPDYRVNSPQTGGLSGNTRNQNSNGGGGGNGGNGGGGGGDMPLQDPTNPGGAPGSLYSGDPNQGLTRRERRQARRDSRGNKSVLTPEQIQLLSSITGNVNRDIQGGEGFGLDPLAQGAYDNLSRQFGAGSEFGRLGEEAGLKLLRGEQLIPYSDPGREQFYKEAFLDPATANFKNDILPNIQEQYAGRGLEAGRSGDLLNAELTAGRRLATDLGAQRANLLRGDQDRALLGLGQAYGAASTPQEIAFNTGQQNRFLQNQYSNPAYGIAPLALGTQPYATRQRTGGGSNAQLIGSAVGAGLGALGNYYGSQNRGGGGGTTWSSWG